MGAHHETSVKQLPSALLHNLHSQQSIRLPRDLSLKLPEEMPTATSCPSRTEPGVDVRRVLGSHHSCVSREKPGTLENPSPSHRRLERIIKNDSSVLPSPRSTAAERNGLMGMWITESRIVESLVLGILISPGGWARAASIAGLRFSTCALGHG